jgi:hypothetical protein
MPGIKKRTNPQATWPTERRTQHRSLVGRLGLSRITDEKATRLLKPEQGARGAQQAATDKIE